MEHNNNQQALETKSKQNLINALEVGSKPEINIILRQYKQPNGVIYFPALFEIKSESRLPALFEQDPIHITTIVTGALTLVFEAMNLKRPLTAVQIADLADTILESSTEDNLALEDLMLFLQKLMRGEYGKMYESMDIPKFMSTFEIYREDRFQALKTLRDEQNVQYKTLPINDRLLTMRELLSKTKTDEGYIYLKDLF